MLKSLRIDGLDVTLRRFGKEFILINSNNADNLNALGSAIYKSKIDHLEEVIVTPSEICLKTSNVTSDDIIEKLEEIKIQQSDNSSIWKLPVCFDIDADWSIVEDFTGLPKKSIINQIIESKITVGMFGFIPGFIYFDGLPESLHVPRKKVPSKYVEPHSIGIGGRYLGLYSLPSPGGWNIIGRTPISLLQIPEIPPVKIQLNDTIQIQSISAKKYQNILDNPISLESYND